MKNRLQNILNESKSESVSEKVSRDASPDPNIDHEKRTIRHVILTDTLADDGGIMLPEGMSVDRFSKNGSVLARHGLPGQAASFRSPVIGRNVSLRFLPHEVEAVTQFADTELGREYAYLYGINDKKEVYVRAWSARADIHERVVMQVERARNILGVAIDMSLLPAAVKKSNSVWVGLRSELTEYSAVPFGADKNALSRAMKDGVSVAGEIILQMDFEEMKESMELLRQENKANKDKLEKFERDMLALSREGAAAAERGDTAIILREIQECVRLMKG